mmetsp:Transcript_4638/g.8306  ORF Transcript_4638/g.8306 Transcript_4638/m.8306 type:complete len:272 (-) Transcript_4638:170-985(-)
MHWSHSECDLARVRPFIRRSDITWALYSSDSNLRLSNKAVCRRKTAQVVSAWTDASSRRSPHDIDASWSKNCTFFFSTLSLETTLGFLDVVRCRDGNLRGRSDAGLYLRSLFLHFSRRLATFRFRASSAKSMTDPRSTSFKRVSRRRVSVRARWSTSLRLSCERTSSRRTLRFPGVIIGLLLLLLLFSLEGVVAVSGSFKRITLSPVVVVSWWMVSNPMRDKVSEMDGHNIAGEMPRGCKWEHGVSKNVRVPRLLDGDDLLEMMSPSPDRA